MKVRTVWYAQLLHEGTCTVLNTLVGQKKGGLL